MSFFVHLKIAGVDRTDEYEWTEGLHSISIIDCLRNDFCVTGGELYIINDEGSRLEVVIIQKDTHYVFDDFQENTGE